MVETDPLLNAYVQKIAGNFGSKSSAKTFRTTSRFSRTVEVNSFATLGGYVYIDEGLIDFVQSDDELAGVIGHETGHIERRHVLTSQSKLEGLNLLFGIASLFSPIIYEFGNLMEAGAYAKIERADELQADRTGLAVDVARGLRSRQHGDDAAASHVPSSDEHNDLVNKYLQDHPDPGSARLTLAGYPELDPTKVTTDQKVVQAASDQERATL